jgi:hypothetical protein
MKASNQGSLFSYSFQVLRKHAKLHSCSHSRRSSDYQESRHIQHHDTSSNLGTAYGHPGRGVLASEVRFVGVLSRDSR